MKTQATLLQIAATLAVMLTSPLASGAAESEPSQSAASEHPPIKLNAGLPAGFPTPGPANQITLKTYPAYRAAHAEGSDAFMQLFRHIQSNDIAMTAPVEMTLTPVADGETRVSRADMFFMYARPNMGQVGPDADSATADQAPRVHVTDLPPIQVLSLGFFGNATPNRINQALDALRVYLETRSDLIASGPPRLLGYHSPFVPADRRFSEVQIPVTSAQAESTAEDQTSDADAPNNAAATSTAAVK